MDNSYHGTVPKVWIVEIQFDGERKWSPTVGIALSREDGRRVQHQWQINNPCERFRLRQYRRLSPTP